MSDYVLCRVQLKDKDHECFVPGKIIALPSVNDKKMFLVKLYTGKQVLMESVESVFSFLVVFVILKSLVSNFFQRFGDRLPTREVKSRRGRVGLISAA